MALQKQTVSIDFGGGQDTKTNPKYVIPGKLTRLENAQWRAGVIAKRYGSAALSSLDDNRATLSGCAGIAAFKDSLLRAQPLAAGTQRLLSLSTAIAAWTESQQVPPFATLSRKALVRNDRSQQNVDYASYNGVSVLVWVEPDGPSPGIHALVYDEATGAEFQRDTVLSTLSSIVTPPGFDQGVFPRVLIVGGVAFVLWIDRDGKLYERSLNLAQLLGGATPVVFTGTGTGAIVSDALASTFHDIQIVVGTTGAAGAAFFSYWVDGVNTGSGTSPAVGVVTTVPGGGGASFHCAGGGIYHSGDVFEWQSWSAAQWTAKVTLRTDAVANWFDACIVGSDIALAYVTTDTSHYTLLLLNSAGAVYFLPAPVSVDLTAEGGDTTTIGIGTDDTSIYVACAYIGKVRVFDTSLSQTANFAITPTGLGCVMCRYSTGTMWLAAGARDGGVYSGVLASSVISASAEVSTASLGRGLTIASRPILPTVAGAPVLLAALYFPPPNYSAATVQPSAWLITEAGAVVARIEPGGAWAANGQVSGRIPAPIETSPGVLSFALPEVNRASQVGVGGTGTGLASTQGTAKFTLSLKTWAALPRVSIGDLLFVGGSRPSYWDGSVYAEAGFNVFPENLSNGGSAGGGALSAGAYQWVGVYRWVDAQGNVHRSAPSPAEPASPGAGTKQTINFPTLRQTDKEAVDLSRVTLELYRTEANGSIFYRTAPTITGRTPVTDLSNDPTVDYVALVDNTSDAFLIQQELLYTTGGVLESICPPACTMAAVHGERLFLGGLEDPQEVRYSTIRVPREAVRFNEVLTFRIPATHGKVMGLASLDDKLIVFAERGIYAVMGDGPDALGQNNSYSTPQPIASDVGCADWRSIAETPAGLMFLSEKGFCLLSRALAVEYIGAEVEAYAGYTVRSVQVVEQQNQVRWQVDTGDDTTGVVLVWDYLKENWGIFTGAGGMDSAIWRSTYVRAQSTGGIFQENTGLFTDAGATYAMLLETGWLKLAGLQGFARVYEAFLLGTYNSDATLTWDVAYDYGTAYTDTGVYPGAGVYTAGGPYQIRRSLKQQKCEAIRFRLTESGLTGSCQGVAVENLSMQVGVKRGGYQLPAAKTVG